MTNEEAIKHGKEQLEIFGGEHREFIKLAIKAIEQQPKLLQALEMEKGAYNALVKDLQCSDCISRDYIIDKIGDVDGLEEYDNSNLFAKHYMNLVKNAPSVQPKTRWIPVSERLPEDYGEYICTMSDDNVQECGFVPSYVKELISGWSTCEANGFKKLDYRDIKAWMPLPQPYKAESEEEE